MSEDKLKTLMEQLSSTYSDEEVSRIPELQTIILEAAQELDKTSNVKLVSTKLCNAISFYYLSNKEQFPDAMIELYYKLKSDAETYKGVALSSIMFPLWF